MQLHREDVGLGGGALWTTLDRMRGLLAASLHDPVFVETAARLVVGCGHADDQCRVSRLYQWVQSHVRYVRDPHKMELLRTPSLMLSLIRRTGYAVGDCDDQTLLLASLVKAAGVPVRFVLMSRQADRPYHHIYLEARVGERWVALDPILEYGAPGLVYPAAKKLVVAV